MQKTSNRPHSLEKVWPCLSQLSIQPQITPFQKELKLLEYTKFFALQDGQDLETGTGWLSRHHANGLVKLLSELFMRSSSTLLYFLISSNKIALKAGTGPTAASNYLLYRLQLSEQMVHIVVVIVVDLNCR